MPPGELVRSPDGSSPAPDGPALSRPVQVRCPPRGRSGPGRGSARLPGPQGPAYADEAMIPFSKYTGAGNDFVVVDAGASPAVEPAGLARRICPRSTGVGVDGLALVEREGDGRLGVRFFNPDGTEFATCGNGTRCVARYAVDRGLVEDEAFDLATGEGDVRASVQGDEVTLTYRIACRVVGDFAVPFPGDGGDGEARGWLVQMGTPHFVLPVERMPGGEFEEVARTIRHHPPLGEEGANVNLVSLHDRGHGTIRTFERGVEGETLACGAGAMSAALALHRAGLSDRRLRLETRGGEPLAVALEEADEEGEPPGERTLRLAGPARHLFDGEFPEAPDGSRAGPGT